MVQRTHSDQHQGRTETPLFRLKSSPGGTAEALVTPVETATILAEVTEVTITPEALVTPGETATILAEISPEVTGVMEILVTPQETANSVANSPAEVPVIVKFKSSAGKNDIMELAESIPQGELHENFLERANEMMGE